MEVFEQKENLTVIGVRVTTFPNGIKEAFESLMKTLGSDRAYFGISWFDEGGTIQYYAMAQEAFTGEAKKYNYEKLIIEKGNYLSETVHNWLSKTDCIKDVFHALMTNNTPHKNHPCIEWYKSDEEMVCMVRGL